MAFVTTLSSLGTSVPVILNPVPKSTTIQITVASGASGAGGVFAQYTLDTVTATNNVQTWANLSSAILSSAADPTVGSSVAVGGVTYTMLSPIAGLRLASTGTVTGTVTLKALQSVTA
jgi:hypothetical protein